VVDNYATHKHPTVERWLAAHPRCQVHYTPTYAPRLNQAEIWFNLIMQRAIRRGTFRSIKDLVSKIELFVQHYKARTSPFGWTATPDSILAKVEQLFRSLSETRHYLETAHVAIQLTMFCVSAGRLLPPRSLLLLMNGVAQRK
jgi:putative transposase